MVAKPTTPTPLAPSTDPRAALRVYEEFLGHKAFVRRVDLSVLTRIAVDETAPARERRRAAEALGQLYLKAVEIVGQLARVKEEVAGPWGRPAPRDVRPRRPRTRKAGDGARAPGGA